MLQSSSVESWENKQALLFALDGSLLDQQFNQYLWQEIIPKTYASLHSLSLAQAKTLVASYQNAVNNTLDDYAIDYWEKTLGINLLALTKQHAHMIRLNKYAEKFLFYIHNLKERPKCYLIANEHPELLDFKLQLTGLECFFDHVTSCYEIGMLKHQKEFWPKYFQHVNLEPTSAVLFEADANGLQSAVDSGLEIIANKSNKSESNYIEYNKVKYINDLNDLLPTSLNTFDIIYAR